MQRDIIERLMDFERCGLTPRERVNLRECAAIEIHKLRQEIARPNVPQNITGNITKKDDAVIGLEALLAAVHADDPKREILVRIGDIMRELKSAPERSATQNTAEGLPPAMAQCAGADTCECGKGAGCSRPYECWAYRLEQQDKNLRDLIKRGS